MSQVVDNGWGAFSNGMSASSAAPTPKSVLPPQWLFDIAAQQFVCETCKQMLDDAVVAVHSGKMHCRSCVPAGDAVSELSSRDSQGISKLCHLVWQLQQDGSQSASTATNSVGRGTTSSGYADPSGSTTPRQPQREKMVKVKRSRGDSPASPTPSSHPHEQPGSASKTFFHVVSGADGAVFEQQQMAPLNPNLDLASQKAPSGPLPTPRASHNPVVDQNNIPNLDIASMKVSSGPLPTPRSSHNPVVDQNNIPNLDIASMKVSSGPLPTPRSSHNPVVDRNNIPNLDIASMKVTSGPLPTPRSSRNPVTDRILIERQMLAESAENQIVVFLDNERQMRQEINGKEGLDLYDLAQRFNADRRKIASRESGSRFYKTEADLKYESTEYSLAIELYTKAIESQPNDQQTKLVTIYGNRSAANYMAGRFEDSIKDCEQVLLLDPKSAKMFHRAAKAAVGLGDLRRADGFFKRIPADKMEPYQADREKLDSGLSTLQAAEASFGLPEGDGPWSMLVAHYPEAVPLRIRQAEHYAAKEQYSKAAETLNFFVGSNRTAEVAYYIAKYNYLCGFEQFNAAKEALEPFLSRSKKCMEIFNTIRVVDEGKQEGNNHFAQKRFAQAAECYTRAIDCGKDNNATLRILYCNRAAAYKELGKNREGADDCTKAIRIAPDFSKAYARRARCLQNLGEHLAAVKDFKQAVRFESGDRDLQKDLHLAESLLAKEQEKEKDFYYVMNIPRTATDDVIRARYKELVLKFHPDKTLHLEANERAAAEHKFKMIAAAHATLSDPVKRREFDLKQDIAKDRTSRPSSFTSAFGASSSASGFGGRRGPGDMPGRTQNFW